WPPDKGEQPAIRQKPAQAGFCFVRRRRFRHRAWLLSPGPRTRPRAAWAAVIAARFPAPPPGATGPASGIGPGPPAGVGAPIAVGIDIDVLARAFRALRVDERIGVRPLAGFERGVRGGLLGLGP